MKTQNLIKIAALVGTVPLGAFAANINVPSDYSSIQAAVNAAAEGDEILVRGKLFGSYNENVQINKNNLTIRRTGLLPVTVIGQSGQNSLGTFVLNNVSGVTLSDMIIIGIDNDNPGIENATIYIQGNSSDVTITKNTITAVGDSAILSEYGTTVDGVTVTHNAINGITFKGNRPEGNGFSSQFTLPNVPRPAVILGGPATSNITFSNNVVTVKTGGINSVGDEQGNTVVTIHSAGSVIEENIFSSISTRYASQLRVRGNTATIRANGFVSLAMGEQTSQVYLDTTDGDLLEVFEQNVFDNASFADNEGKTIYKRLAPALAASANDATVVFHGTQPGGVVIDKSISLVGFGGSQILGNLTGDSVAVSVEASDVSIEDVTITAITSENGTGVKLAPEISNITIADSNIYARKYGIVNSLPGGNDGVSVISNTIALIGENNGNAIYLNGAASSGIDNVGTLISGNYFAGNGVGGLIVGVEGSDTQVSRNDFADASSDYTIVEIWNGDAEIDGNCFAASAGAIITASGGAVINAAYNYFGDATGAVESNYAGNVTVTPYLTQCDAAYIEAIQAPHGMISPAFAYTNASEAAVFTMTPDALSIVEDVLVNGNSVGPVGSYDASALTEDSAITAVFTSSGASITVETNGSGTVSPDGIVIVTSGDDRSFVLTPTAGYSIGTVEYNGNDITSQVSPAGLLTIANVTGANTLEVTFVGQSFNVTAVKSGVYARYGNVTPASTSVSTGGSVEFTITCPASFAVRQVKVNGAVVSTAKITTGGTYTVENINSNTTVEFSFGLNN